VARHVTIATVSNFPLRLDGSIPPEQVADLEIALWRERLDTVLPLRPDLVVLPEHCDRPWGGSYPAELLEQYWPHRGDRVLDFLAEVAATHRTNIVYSARREDGERHFNASRIIDRTGTVAGTYDKCFLTTGEFEGSGYTPGAAARLIELDFGTVAPAICFDLNFEELLDEVVALRPEVIAFSSNFHGGYLQQHWAYSARAYFVGAICPPSRSEIRNPFGEVVATSTNYRHEAVGTVNLDSALIHIDLNRTKFDAIRKEYGRDVRIHDPGSIGAVQLIVEGDGFSVDDVIEKFELIRLDDYFAHVRTFRASRDGAQ